eukprot:GFKZ01005550.1.p1 GENE.GFKZ01005550.1~~GFKZ01005550.1.p1  ORF type:complete len:596 (+),score=68.95 GFKZ01005550.1:112-1788(+)
MSVDPTVPPPQVVAESPLPDVEDPVPTYPPFHRLPPPAEPAREPFRDVNFGPFTIHRLTVVLFQVVFITGLFYIQEAIWPAERFGLNTGSGAWYASQWWGLIWLTAFPSAVAAFIGNLWFSYNTRLDEVGVMEYPVVFRVVSRGMNREVLMETVHRIQKEMRDTALFPYLIELVTDGDVFCMEKEEVDVVHLRVPKGYVTEKGTLFKARALNYACEYSRVGDDTWVVHLDEETQPTASCVKGIADFVGRCERRGGRELGRVGQGLILYHRSLEKHPFLTMADMRRTGDDFGHYSLQHRLGFTLFGLHGAYIVVRQGVEKEVGFDLGGAGSITEDAWWVLMMMERGYRTGWVDGWMEEQSTQSVMDFLRQRRRWYYGLSKVVLECPVKKRWRAMIGFNTLSWLMVPFLMPLQFGYMVLLWVKDVGVTEWVRVLTNFVVGMMLWVYVGGLVLNLREHGTRWYKWPMWLMVMVVSFPFCLAMEVASVIMAFFAGCSANGRGFHVVQKSATAEEEGEGDGVGKDSEEGEGKGSDQGEGETTGGDGTGTGASSCRTLEDSDAS